MAPWKKKTELSIEIRIGCVIDLEAGGEHFNMADDVLVAMDLSGE